MTTCLRHCFETNENKVTFQNKVVLWLVPITMLLGRAVEVQKYFTINNKNK